MKKRTIDIFIFYSLLDMAVKSKISALLMGKKSWLSSRQPINLLTELGRNKWQWKVTHEPVGTAISTSAEEYYL
jgi:hypothetical protein